MFSKGSALALAISSLSSFVFAQDTNIQNCPYTPAWNQCQGDDYKKFECATILVTKSYLLPASTENTYELNLIRYPATVDKDNAESIITNFGGPGESGIQGIIGQGQSLSEQVNGELHIVSFDPRGVGINDPYDCVSNADYPTSNNYHDQNVVDKFYKAAAQSADTCNKQNPVKGKQIGTIAVAKDVRQIAYAVGINDKLIRYWGFSYGTVLGDTIARLFPDEIGGMVLDGNINPNDYWFQFPAQEAANLDAGFKHFFQLCADAKSECAYNDDGTETYDSLLSKFNDWVGATPDSRGTTSDLTAEESYLVRDMVSQGIKYGSTYKKCGNVLRDWYDHRENITAVGDFSDFEDPGNPNTPANKKTKRQYDSNNNGNFEPDESDAPHRFDLIAITGADNQFRPGDLSGEVYTEWLQQYENVSQYAGDVSIENLFKYAPWIPQSEEYFNTAFENIETTPNPIIFVQTHYDPVTPSDSGLAAHAAFTNSMYVTTNGIGHCSSSDPSADLKKAIGLYWNSNKIPADKTNYDLDNPNPFIDIPPGNQNVETDENPMSPGEKRDISSLFTPLVRRAGEDTILSCQGSNSTTNTTTSAPYGNGTSTSTTSRSTTTSGVTTTSGNGTVTSTTSRYTTTPKATTTSGSGTLTSTTSRYTTATASTTKSGNGTSTFSTSSYTTKSGYTTTSGNGTSTYTTSSYTTSSGFKTSTWTTSSTTSGVSTAKNTNSWGSWDGGYTSSSSSSIWNAWDPKPTTTTSTTTTNSAWNAWNSGSKPTTTRSKPVDPSTSTQWQGWSPNDPSKSTTTYVYSVVDVCPTGLVTSKVTITATCTKSCGGKPVVPDGYKTTAVYCSACATPSTVTVTVKVTGSASSNADGAWNTWKSADPSTKPSTTPTTTATADQDWNVWSNADPNSVKPTTAATTATPKGDWNNWGSADPTSVKPTTTASATASNGDWNNWGTGNPKSVDPTSIGFGSGSATGSAMIAKYTGGASANVVKGGLYVVAAAVLVL